MGGGVWSLFWAGAVGEADGVVLSVDAGAVGWGGGDSQTGLGAHIPGGWGVVAVGSGVWFLVPHQLANYLDVWKAGDGGLCDR